MAGKYTVFISYRREDSPGHAGRIYDRVRGRLGPEQVFWDIEIEPGVDFVEVIEQAVGSCQILIAIIGRNWLNAVDSQGSPRLENPDDFVRLEIESALRRNILVIPVLVFGAPMPRPADLPEALRKLARRNALEISDRRFDDDVERLIKMLEKVLMGAEARDNFPFAPQAPTRREPLPLSDIVTGAPAVPEPLPQDVPEKVGIAGTYFSKDHVWIEVEGRVATIGITDYAQNALGDIVYIDLPRTGESFGAHDSFGAIESVKAVSDLFIPVSGEVAEVNNELLDEPERINADPRGKGWLVRVKLKEPRELDILLTAEEYNEFIKSETE